MLWFPLQPCWESVSPTAAQEAANESKTQGLTPAPATLSAPVSHLQIMLYAKTAVDAPGKTSRKAGRAREGDPGL